MVKNSDEIIADILSNPAPIIFLDTCIYLDTVRALKRENLLSSYIKDASSLTNIANNKTNRLWLLTSEICDREWSNNIDNTCQEVETHLKLLHNSIIRYKEVASIFNFTQPTINNRIDFIRLLDQTKAISKNMLDISIKIKEEDRFDILAMKRIRGNIAPASKGKNELFDCHITEQVLECCQKLRAESFSDSFIFVTSNITDYGDINKLKTPLDLQFDINNIEYVTNISWALNKINP